MKKMTETEKQKLTVFNQAIEETKEAVKQARVEAEKQTITAKDKQQKES